MNTQLKAKWVSKDCSDLFYCSNCDAKFGYWENYSSCPVCGAEFDGYIDLDDPEDEE